MKENVIAKLKHGIDPWGTPFFKRRARFSCPPLVRRTNLRLLRFSMMKATGCLSDFHTRTMRCKKKHLQVNHRKTDWVLRRWNAVCWCSSVSRFFILLQASLICLESLTIAAFQSWRFSFICYCTLCSLCAEMSMLVWIYFWKERVGRKAKTVQWDKLKRWRCRSIKTSANMLHLQPAYSENYAAEKLE